MAYQWKPKDYIAVMTAATGNLLLAIIVIATMIGLLTHQIKLEEVGKIGPAGAAVGISSFALIVFWVIRLANKHGDNND